MAEIDFDELDQAVTSLMKDATSMKQMDSQPAEDSHPHEEVEIPRQKEVTPEPEQVPVTRVSAPASQTPSVATRRRGQFMDVMHPSADMRKNTPTSSPSIDSVSRHSTILQPSAGFAGSVSDAAPRASSLSVPAPKETPTTADTEHGTAWPDPIDFVKSTEAAEQESIETPPPELSNEPAPEEKTPLAAESEDMTASTASTASATPFLTDAKVEKRPLGGTNPATMLTPVLDGPGEVEAPEEPHTLAQTDTPIDAPMPAELGEDVMNVESGEILPHTSPAPVTPVQPIVEPDANEPSGPSSIPPQYHTSELSQAEPEHASMYATDHQDLATPTKKKSGWLIPIIILVLLILGGLGGYLAYSLHIFG